MAANQPLRVLIVGGVAGGASAAARLRRLCEHASIKIFERGPYASFANCGLPYRVGLTIQNDEKLLIASPELFRDRFNIEVLTNHEVLRINRDRKTLSVRRLAAGEDFEEPYDKVVLAPGAKPIRPNLPGVDLPGVFVLRNIPDMRAIMTHLDEKKDARAVIVGGGFIGLEMAEQLGKRGLGVTILEKAPHVMMTLSDDLANLVQARMRERGVHLVTGDGVTGIERRDEAGHLLVKTESGADLPADIVLLAIGVVPDSQLAKEAGLRLGVRGSVWVDAHMTTSDPDILCVGDVVEATNFVTGAPTNVPLAGPANRMGRLAADVIAGRDATFRGVQSTAVCESFGLTIASSGESEASLQRQGVPYACVNVHPGNHVSYFPGASQMHLKLFFDPVTGRVLGVQGVGEGEGVARRVDVVSFAIQMRATVHDLAQAELCYSPSMGAAKDAVNMLGFVAENSLRVEFPLADWGQVPHHSESDSPADGVYILDVRSPAEFAAQHVPTSTNIPLESLRARLHEVPRDKTVNVLCQAGQRAYYALQLLRHNNIDARNLSGGMITYCMREGIPVKRS